jgi:ABC-type multidrug transport system fused ATPase/permease subunit
LIPQLQRFDSITRSPVYAHFGETLNGVSMIRAFRQQDRFIRENESRLNSNQMAYYTTVSANRYAEHPL